MQKDKMGEGRAAATMAVEGVQDAIARWRAAYDSEKGEMAKNVLAHVGAHAGVKLENLVDAETAVQIRADFAARKKK